MPTGGLDIGIGAALTSGLAEAGVGATTAGLLSAGITDAAIGAGGGALFSGITGGNPLTGALTGGLTGGAIGGFGSSLGDLTGLGTTFGDTLAGAGAGALGAGITGGNPLIGAVEGGGSGLLAGALSSSSTAPAGTAPATGTTAGGGVGGPTGGAASLAAPSGIGGVSTPDITNLSFSAPGSDSLSALSGTGSASGSGFGSLPSGDNASFLSGGSGGGGPSVGPLASGPTAANPSILPAASSGSNSILDALSKPTGSNIISALSKNANLLVPAAGIGYQAIEGQQNPKGLSQLEQQAGQLSGQGQTLQNYLNTGTLPPGLQGSLDQAAQSAKASIRSQYASRGMSGSSAEAQDLASVDQRIQAQGASLAMNLLQQGVSETNLSSQLYGAIMQEQLQQDKELSDAIAGFATAAAGGNSGGEFKLSLAR